jgi:hypothetical protein
MHSAFGKNSILYLCSALLVTGCSTEPEYDDRTVELSEILKNTVEQVFDNGYIMSGNDILVPYQISQDGFYLVDSPEQLDSVFRYIYYPSPDSPRLDSLFPDGGSLLVLDQSLLFCEEIINHTYSFSKDTVLITLTVRRWLDRIYDPGIWFFVFPIGIVFETPDGN